MIIFRRVVPSTIGACSRQRPLNRDIPVIRVINPRQHCLQCMLYTRVWIRRKRNSFHHGKHLNSRRLHALRSPISSISITYTVLVPKLQSRGVWEHLRYVLQNHTSYLPPDWQQPDIRVSGTHLVYRSRGQSTEYRLFRTRNLIGDLESIPGCWSLIMGVRGG